MNFGHYIQPAITQQLTPQMIQSLHVLQLSALELQELIQEKALDNPLIEIIEKDSTYDWVKLAATNYNFNLKALNYESAIFRTSNLKETIKEQIPLKSSLQQVKILEYLIDSLDERLFLEIEIQEIVDSLKVSKDDVKEGLQILKTFEPFGIGSSNIKEFLIKHVEKDVNSPKFAKEFIENEMKAISKFEISKLSKCYEISPNDVLTIFNYIKSLPRTPEISIEELPHYIIPDAQIYRVDNQWLIELNDITLPSIKVHDVYVELLKQENPNYLKKCMRDFITLVQGIDFRKATLYSIIDYLLIEQEAYFELGRKALKSIRLKDVANSLQVHESTISRAIKGKYIQSPQGIVEIQELFVKPLGNSTPTEVCLLISKIIKNEPKTKPFSDQTIAELLKKRGIDISRRTVTKYRERLNIPSSKERIYLFST